MAREITLTLTASEADALLWELAEDAMRLDDDGNEGAFAATPLAVILRKLRAAMVGAET